MYAIAGLIFVAIAGLFYWFSVRTFKYWERRGVMFVRPTPLFGNLADTLLLRRNFCFVHEDLYKQFPEHPFVGIYQARSPALLIRDPDLIRAILVQDFHHFQDRNIVIHPKENPTQENLFTVRGKRWQFLRCAISSTFTSGRLKQMFPLMDECREKLVKNLQQTAERHQVVEIKDILGNFATDVVGTCFFGLEMHALDDSDAEFRQMGRKVFQSSAIRRLVLLLNILLPELAQWFKLEDLGSGVSKFFIQAVKEVIHDRETTGRKRHDFIQQMIELKNQHDCGMHEMTSNRKAGNAERSEYALDDASIAAHAFLFFLAGFETSSSVASFALHELAQLPQLQRRVRAEVRAALHRGGGRLSYDALARTPLLDKVVAESMRKYPPVQFLRRAVTSPYTVPGTAVRLDSGAHVIIPIYAIHRDAQHYPQPDLFDPERFSERAKAARHHYAYLPFGEGPRHCIAKRFALLQTKLGLAGLLAAYAFSPGAESVQPPAFSARSFVLEFEGGVHLRVRPCSAGDPEDTP